MDDASHLLTMLSPVYGAQSVSSSIPASATQIISPIRVSASHRSTVECPLHATRDVGHELVSVLASKVVLEQALDQLLCGLILVTADLKVLSANKSARAGEVQRLTEANRLHLVL